MATLKRYENDTGYYVQHSFRVEGCLLHVTYQVSDAALAIFERKGIRDGSSIPKPLLHDLIRSEELFTGSSGATGGGVEDTEPKDHEHPFNRLSAESRNWIALRTIDHPATRTRMQDCPDDAGEEIEVDGIPDGFFHQLVAVAQSVDGTEFIRNLDSSYREHQTSIEDSKFLDLAPIESKLGLPRGVFSQLLAGDDWSSIIKIEALLEAALSHSLTQAIEKPELAGFFARLSMADSSLGKVAVAKTLGILSKEDANYIRYLAELRNDLIHDIRRIGFSLATRISEMDSHQFDRFLRVCCVGVDFDSLASSNPNLRAEIKANPKRHLMYGAFKILKEFADNENLCNWIRMAHDQIEFQGLPSRICWLGYGERARFGLMINDLIANGEISAPMVIGRDHLDCGSVASPNRETEGMKDGSDAIADWPLLNAMLNVASGATWVSLHHGGGVGIGNSIHSGQVVLADGTPEAAARIQRVLTNDPGTGVMRHADAGYEQAIDFARDNGIDRAL